MIIQVSNEMYANLSETERKIVDYLNNNEDKVPKMSITAIADSTYTSVSTVSRAIHKCGFQSISELKYRILNKHSQVDEPYIENESLLKTYRECTNTLNQIKTTQLMKVIEYIKQSERIYVFARGLSGLIAEEFYTYLVFMGFNVHVVKDSIVMKSANEIMNENDLAIFITVKNTTPELTEAAAYAKEIGSKVVVCTCVENIPLKEYADVMLVGYSEEVMKRGSFSEVSRLGLYIIVHAIIDYLNS